MALMRTPGVENKAVTNLKLLLPCIRLRETEEANEMFQ
jgi:hypothetical protein